MLAATRREFPFFVVPRMVRAFRRQKANSQAAEINMHPIQPV
jgi:hypothetical protein